MAFRECSCRFQCSVNVSVVRAIIFVASMSALTVSSIVHGVIICCNLREYENTQRRRVDVTKISTEAATAYAPDFTDENLAPFLVSFLSCLWIA